MLVAGIDLGEATDSGFTDIDSADAERRDAVNRPVGAGIMFGANGTTAGAVAAPVAPASVARGDLVHISNPPPPSILVLARRA